MEALLKGLYPDTSLPVHDLMFLHVVPMCEPHPTQAASGLPGALPADHPCPEGWWLPLAWDALWLLRRTLKMQPWKEAATDFFLHTAHHSLSDMH